MTQFQNKSFAVAQSGDKAKFWPKEWVKQESMKAPESTQKSKVIKNGD